MILVIKFIFINLLIMCICVCCVLMLNVVVAYDVYLRAIVAFVMVSFSVRLYFVRNVVYFLNVLYM